MNDEMQLTAVFIKITELAAALGIKNINQLPGAWIYPVDAHWTIAINGHDAPIDIPADGVSMGATIAPYHTAVWYNGWLAGILTPVDGILSAGSAANEDTLIAALDAAIGRQQSGQLSLL